MTLRDEKDVTPGTFYLIKGWVGDLPIPEQYFYVSSKGQTLGRPWVKGICYVFMGKVKGKPTTMPDQHLYLDQVGIGIPVWHDNDIHMETMPPEIGRLARGYHEVIQENNMRAA